MHDDRRKHLRLPLTGFMECTAQFDIADQSFAMNVTSLSAGGLFVTHQTNDPQVFMAGSRLKNLRFNHDDLSAFRLNGEIMYALTMGNLLGFGVAFRGISQDEQQDLDRYVREKIRVFAREAEAH